ncbi:protein WVD2-like 7 isoform X1 [Benincasa hispida]|uniref:protein WVD2-like 7 isoform X1 n=1 Tax=Benincasa hispida TaxID=102211 RepID=UPI0019003E7C|nr:protein WVD2-like 7 isoform X1 [Benincasa hispida]
MGESACLLRSFSHPSDASREAKEGDPIRALGESISFGRFMSESLAWEKWSAFSHNRYQEELEKFSKPGSVAQKKAYFEAHYKRKAAQKAAAELEEANTTATTNQVETEEKEFCSSSCVEPEPLRSSSQVIETNEQQNFVQNAEFVSPTDADARDSMNEERMVEILITDKVEEEVLDQNNSMETAPNIENGSQNEKDEDHSKTVVAEEAKTPAVNPPAEKEIMSSGGSLKRLRNYSSKLLTRSWSSKPQSSPTKQATTSSQRYIHKGNATPKSKKPVGNIVEHLSMKSVHMSMNFNSGLKEIGRTSPKLPQIGRKRTHMSSLAASKETSTPSHKFVSRVAASVNGLLKQPLIKPPLENIRCLKSLNATGTGSKERPPLICSPFSFRSEERVAKRREFFQKLEEKANSKEMEQKQLQARCQERKKNDISKLSQSRNFEAKANQDNQGSKSTTDHIKKIPVTRPRSPKLGRKSASSSAVQNISSLPPKRPSVTSNDSKSVVRKRYESTTQSVTSFGKKTNGCENFSPNIQT